MFAKSNKHALSANNSKPRFSHPHLPNRLDPVQAEAPRGSGSRWSTPSGPAPPDTRSPGAAALPKRSDRFSEAAEVADLGVAFFEQRSFQ